MALSADDIVDAANAASVTKDELTALLKGGVVNVRNSIRRQQIEKLKTQRTANNQSVEDQINALAAQIATDEAKLADVMGL